MAQGNNNNFLTIPSQEGLFRTVKVDRSEDSSHPVWDEDEEDAEEDVRLIPRSSPVPRKRGSSIADETAEYMRIRLALPCRKVSFADSTGAELADVRMFVPFDSDEEDESRWEEELSRYRKAYREPTYSLWPEFQVLAGTELLLAVHNNKLEVENVTPLADEPLSFEVQIRVLNISFHKSVFVRSTMDGWISHFDYPAEYVQGSSDGDTDRFSVTLSFASPYLFNGARIDFVVRYETSSGEFWANNAGRNYAVSLLQSYEEETPPAAAAPDTLELRGILKPARYRTSLNHDDCDDKGDEDLSSAACGSEALQSSFQQPVMFQPDIDIEVSKAISHPSRSTRTPSTSDCLCSASNTFSTQPHCDSLNNRPPDKADRIVTFSLPTILVHTCDVTGAVEVPCLPDPNFNSKNEDVSSESSVPFESGLSAPAVLRHIQEECEKNRADDFHRIMFRDAAMLEEPNQPRTKTQEATLSLPSNDDGCPVSSSKGSPLPEEAQEPTSFSYSQGHPGCPVILPTMTSDSLTTTQEIKDLDPTEISSELQKCFTLNSDDLSTSAYQEPEVQQPLPGESAEVTGMSKDQEVNVDKCLITSATFFCAVICLTVGIQEPRVFLYLGIFLLSMCF